MAEQRENKLKTFIDGKRDLNVDDGDHGVSQGFLRRKVLNQYSSALHSLLKESSRNVGPVDIDAAELNVGLKSYDSQRQRLNAPSTMKNMQASAKGFEFSDEKNQSQTKRSFLDQI